MQPPSCTCACTSSLRALELFVTDFSTLAVRRRALPPPHPPSLPRHHRTFASTPLLRQVLPSSSLAEIPRDGTPPIPFPVLRSGIDVSTPALGGYVRREVGSRGLRSGEGDEAGGRATGAFESAADVAVLSASKGGAGVERKRRGVVGGVSAPRRREREVGQSVDAGKRGQRVGANAGIVEMGRPAPGREQAGRSGSKTAVAGTRTPRVKNATEGIASTSPRAEKRTARVRDATAMAKTSTARIAAAREDKRAQAKTPPPRKTKDRETWQVQKASLERKFGAQGWQPKKRLSPDTLEGIRALHVSDPSSYDTKTLAKHFAITPEAIRRILKSKWRPNEEQADNRRLRWERRGVKKWTEMAELGMRPPSKWRALGVSSKAQLQKRAKDGQGREGGDVVAWDADDEVVSRGESFAGRIL